MNQVKVLPKRNQEISSFGFGIQRNIAHWALVKQFSPSNYKPISMQDYFLPLHVLRQTSHPVSVPPTHHKCPFEQRQNAHSHNTIQTID
mmetsp:Transcript_30989/g.52967  ORF Transcript_30989/g.52967 Transcript_30989/m.52967 type:complete len:89 (+) Transcript_30989:180-446(+)